MHQVDKKLRCLLLLAPELPDLRPALLPHLRWHRLRVSGAVLRRPRRREQLCAVQDGVKPGPSEWSVHLRPTHHQLLLVRRQDQLPDLQHRLCAPVQRLQEHQVCQLLPPSKQVRCLPRPLQTRKQLLQRPQLPQQHWLGLPRLSPQVLSQGWGLLAHLRLELPDRHHQRDLPQVHRRLLPQRDQWTVRRQRYNLQRVSEAGVPLHGLRLGVPPPGRRPLLGQKMQCF
jgi:hypothetical protein